MRGGIRRMLDCLSKESYEYDRVIFNVSELSNIFKYFLVLFLYHTALNKNADIFRSLPDFNSFSSSIDQLNTSSIDINDRMDNAQLDEINGKLGILLNFLNTTETNLNSHSEIMNLLDEYNKVYNFKRTYNESNHRALAVDADNFSKKKIKGDESIGNTNLTIVLNYFQSLLDGNKYSKLINLEYTPEVGTTIKRYFPNIDETPLTDDIQLSSGLSDETIRLIDNPSPTVEGGNGSSSKRKLRDDDDELQDVLQQTLLHEVSITNGFKIRGNIYSEKIIEKLNYYSSVFERSYNFLKKFQEATFDNADNIIDIIFILISIINLYNDLQNLYILESIEIKDEIKNGTSYLTGILTAFQLKLFDLGFSTKKQYSNFNDFINKAVMIAKSDSNYTNDYDLTLEYINAGYSEQEQNIQQKPTIDDLLFIKSVNPKKRSKVNVVEDDMTLEDMTVKDMTDEDIFGGKKNKNKNKTKTKNNRKNNRKTRKNKKRKTKRNRK
jgi:hypothetical protein